MKTPLRTFDLQALYAALDEKRKARELSWPALAADWLSSRHDDYAVAGPASGQFCSRSRSVTNGDANFRRALSSCDAVAVLFIPQKQRAISCQV